MVASIDRIVTLTSDALPVPYGATASSEFGVGNEAYKAFDKADSQWVTASTTTGWIYYNFGSAKWAVTGYSLEPQTTARMCKTWTFEGSNDATSWTVLDTQTNVTVWTTGVAQTFNFINTITFRYYRLNVTANNGDATFLEIDEIQMYAPDFGIMGDII